MNQTLSSYEKRALKDIKDFKHPPSRLPEFLSFLGDVAEVVGKRAEELADYAMDNAVGAVLQKAVEGVVSMCMDAASWSVRTETILEEFREAGHPVHSLADIQACSLEDVDKVVGYLAAKYKALAFSAGAASGAVGLPGIPASVAALVGLSLRATSEYATYYGFDLTNQAERMFCMSLLALASGATGAAKQALLAQLAQSGAMAGKKAAWKALEQQAVVRAMQQIAKSLGIHLTKAKLAQIAPVAGAVVGGSFDALFMSNVTEAAFQLYRERFLIEKYGDWVEQK